MDKQRYERLLADTSVLLDDLKHNGYRYSEKQMLNKIRALLPKRTTNAEYNLSLENLYTEILIELNKAREAFPTDYNSLHEAYGVIAEEIHELFIEIIQKEPDLKKVRKEAIQSIVVLLRLILELTPNEG